MIMLVLHVGDIMERERGTDIFFCGPLLEENPPNNPPIANLQPAEICG